MFQDNTISGKMQSGRLSIIQNRPYIQHDPDPNHPGDLIFDIPEPASLEHHHPHDPDKMTRGKSSYDGLRPPRHAVDRREYPAHHIEDVDKEKG